MSENRRRIIEIVEEIREEQERIKERAEVRTGFETATSEPDAAREEEEAFFFDDDGLLRRHDYVADIVGWFARGAHRWDDFVDVGGVPVARRRHVVARLGRLEVPLVALHAQFRDVSAIVAPGGPRLTLV